MNPMDPYNQQTPSGPPQPQMPPSPQYQPAPNQMPMSPQPGVVPTSQPSPYATQPMQPQPQVVQPMYGPPQPATVPQPLMPPYGQTPQSPYVTNYSASSDDGSNTKKIILIVVAMLVVLGIAIAAVLLLTKKGGSSNPVSNAVSSVTGGTKDIVSRPDGTLDLSTLIDEQTSIKEQTLKAKPNQQINQVDGLSYMVTGVHRNFTSNSTYVKAGPGKELVKIDLVVGNRQKSGDQYISSSNFQARNSAGGLQDSEYVTTEDESDALDSQNVAPGKQIKGSIIFEVDPNEEVTLVSINKYKNYTDNKEVTVQSEVALK
ncbi:MAG: hypothetical protein JWM37_247 [Candidatus Saccharibacteria bacterium]|nr:hypothetical protein [Candidatus Saccharibacteria bacterium]